MPTQLHNLLGLALAKGLKFVRFLLDHSNEQPGVKPMTRSWTAQDSRNAADMVHIRAYSGAYMSAPDSAQIREIVSTALANVQAFSKSGMSHHSGYYGTKSGYDDASVNEAAQQLRRLGYTVIVGSRGYLKISW